MRLQFLLAVVAVVGCGKQYSVDVANYTDMGVILLNMPVTGGLMKKGPHPQIYVAPGIPGTADAIRWVGLFDGYDDRLPDQVTVSWQLAALTDCEEIRRFESQDDDHDPHIYFWGRGCHWKDPAPRIHTKTFDMDEIRKTGAYKQAGQRYGGVAGSKYTLILRFEFRGEDVALKAYNSATNPWK